MEIARNVEKEHKQFGFSGRFGAGLPRINDGALLFLLTMLAKRKPSPEEGGEGSKIAIVFNGSPLFSGDAGSGESNIRRWIIESDWLDAIVALPDQLFYNTGIFTYVWLVTNRKPKHRRGKVQLIDGTRHFKKMKRSLGNKRNELSEAHINEITKLYAAFKDGETCKVIIDDKERERVCSKVFDNREFGFIKLLIERPLRLNFQASPERIERLKLHSAFIDLAESKKRKDKATIKIEQKVGRELQQSILAALAKFDSSKLYTNRDTFVTDLANALEANAVKASGPIRKSIMTALSERDPTADICADSYGNPEPDPELRDTEDVEFPSDIVLPLPIGYDKEADNTALVGLVRAHCENYFSKEVQPHWTDAWIDFSKIKIGYEIPINQHFYAYEALRPLAAIEKDIKTLEGEILNMLKEVA
jgi:type I restriction enzyme M protein